MQQPIKKIISIAIGTIITSSVAYSGAFSLYTEASGAAIGNFAAGIAASVTDASTGWYNPAGLVFLGEEQALISGVGVLPNSPITGTSTFDVTGLTPYVQDFTDLDGARNALVPAFHYALPLGDRAAFGLSVVSPFGLSTQYSYTSPVRYAATLSKLMTIDVSPELAGKITDNFAIGAGLDLQWARVKFNQILGVPPLALVGGLPANGIDSSSENEGNSFGVGFHVGLLGTFNDEHTRVGINYQSSISHFFQGRSVLTAIGSFADTLVTTPDNRFISDALNSNDIYFPNIVTLSAYQDVTDKLALLGSVVFTGWNTFKTIQLNNVAALSPDTGPVLLDTVAEEDYRNAWRFALGANYQVNDQALIRAGFGYDQTPTVNAQRDVRLPDADRWALSIGGHYQMWPSIGFDIGYTYLFAAQETTINKTYPIGDTGTYNTTATAKPYANLVGLQVVWTMDQALMQKTK